MGFTAALVVVGVLVTAAVGVLLLRGKAPTAVEYASIPEFAAAIQDAGYHCLDISFYDNGGEELEDLYLRWGECVVRGDAVAGGNGIHGDSVLLFLVASEREVERLSNNDNMRTGWAAYWESASLEILVGPNWIIVPENRGTASALRRAIGGEVSTV